MTPRHWDAHGPDDDLADLAELSGSPIRTPTDAARVLRLLVGPEARGPAALWCVLLDADDRLLPFVLAISDRPLAPDPGFADLLCDDLASLLEHHAAGGSVVAALVGDTDEDVCDQLTWSTELERSAQRAGVPLAAVVTVGPHGPTVLVPWPATGPDDDPEAALWDEL
ncbi:hypothetical protein [Cellulomonas palmilytica]|uniref:hypothetical protein n=1 Tax=Cellulomonas palmilytica TaxID=2608402 RepID=UPI001F2C8468|nr:hypothetical protein [Cellulomonas palmilytica]UJP38984.1 hypothetical protein F1D97_11455 [Cellulomonas palmilytica]